MKKRQLVASGELCEAVVDNRTGKKGSLGQNRVRTQEETAILERMIFGHEGEGLDEAFWEADGALQTVVAHPGEHQDKDDIMGRELEESEGEADESRSIWFHV